MDLNILKGTKIAALNYAHVSPIHFHGLGPIYIFMGANMQISTHFANPNNFAPHMKIMFAHVNKFVHVFILTSRMKMMLVMFYLGKL